MSTSTRTDEQIANDVRDALTWDSRFDASHVGVTVQDGEVTLTGVVARPSEVAIAAEDAWRIKGVRSVHPRLAVSPMAARTDSDIAADLTNALRWDNRVDDRAIVIAVAGGVVTLSGAVGSVVERRAAEEDARHVPGVVDVISLLSVSPAHRRADSEIEADVRGALTRDTRIVDPTRISVRSLDGVVHLSGGVNTADERRAAEDDAWFTAGVREVVDEVRIVPSPEGGRGAREGDQG